MTQDTSWLVFYGDSCSSKRLLICFPYAGGGPSIFQSWQNLLGKETCVCAVQLPGREHRISEGYISDIKEGYGVIASMLEKYTSREYHFFGHSFGALLAFTVARELRAKGCVEPGILFVSAKVAPHIPESAKIHTLSDLNLKQKLSEYGGTPREVLQNEDLMDIILPRIRSDIGLGERYVFTEEAPLSSKIVAYGAKNDSLAPVEGLKGWGKHTNKSLEMYTYDSDHFYIHSLEQELVGNIQRHIEL